MIYTQFITRFHWEHGSAFGLLLLGLSSLVVFLGRKLSGQSLSQTMGAHNPKYPAPAVTKWCHRAYVTVFFVYLALPLAVVCVFAFSNSVFPTLPVCAP